MDSQVNRCSLVSTGVIGDSLQLDSILSKIPMLFVSAILVKYKLSQIMRKPVYGICENKDADQLRGNREADQRLCFRYIDRIIPLLSKSEISSL